VVRSVPGAPALAQPVQLASLVVVTQSSSLIGLPQYVSLNCGLATCTLPIPFAWRMFISLLVRFLCVQFSLRARRCKVPYSHLRRRRAGLSSGSGDSDPGSGYCGSCRLLVDTLPRAARARDHPVAARSRTPSWESSDFHDFPTTNGLMLCTYLSGSRGNTPQAGEGYTLEFTAERR
jgi:hypothetical protein